MTIKRQAQLGTVIGFIILIGLFFGFDNYLRPPFGGELTIDQKIATDVINLKTTIEADKQDNGKYKRRDKETINGVDYIVHEYETSKGEIGYTIYMTKENDNGIYRKIETTGVQKEITDWIMILDKTVTSTKK